MEDIAAHIKDQRTIRTIGYFSKDKESCLKLTDFNFEKNYFLNSLGNGLE